MVLGLLYNQFNAFTFIRMLLRRALCAYRLRSYDKKVWKEVRQTTLMLDVEIAQWEALQKYVISSIQFLGGSCSTSG